MTTRKVFGDRIAVGVVGSRQVAALPATRTAQPPIQLNRWFRNGKSPNAVAQSIMNEQAIATALFRSKCVFSMGGWLIGGTPSTGKINSSSTPATDRNRWRFAFHTGPYAHALYVVTAQLPDTVSPFYPANAGVRLDLRTGVLSTDPVVATRSLHYGVHPKGSPLTSSDDWGDMHEISGFVDVTPDTDYYGTFVDYDGGRLFAAAVFELPSLTENFSGYPSTNISVQSPVLDVYREKTAQLVRNSWRRGAAQVLNWTVQDGHVPLTFTTATPRNLYDNVSTAYGSSVPGVTLEMSNKARESEAGPQVVVKAYMKCNSANNGIVTLRNAAGTVFCNVNYIAAAGTEGWFSGSLGGASGGANQLVSDKYYLTAHQTLPPNTLEVYAASAYLYDT